MLKDNVGRAVLHVCVSAEGLNAVGAYLMERIVALEEQAEETKRRSNSLRTDSSVMAQYRAFIRESLKRDGMDPAHIEETILALTELDVLEENFSFAAKSALLLANQHEITLLALAEGRYSSALGFFWGLLAGMAPKGPVFDQAAAEERKKILSLIDLISAKASAYA